MSTSAPFPSRLLEARKRASLSQAQLALACGLKDRRGIWHYERGGGSPSLALLDKLAAALGVSAEWLAYGTQQQTEMTMNEDLKLAAQIATGTYAGGGDMRIKRIEDAGRTFDADNMTSIVVEFFNADQSEDPTTWVRVTRAQWREACRAALT